jgi:hypothetical protein
VFGSKAVQFLVFVVQTISTGSPHWSLTVFVEVTVFPQELHDSCSVEEDAEAVKATPSKRIINFLIVIKFKILYI